MSLLDDVCAVAGPGVTIEVTPAVYHRLHTEAAERVHSVVGFQSIKIATGAEVVKVDGSVPEPGWRVR